MLRQLREDAREFPATMTLCALWVVVFLMMVVNQLRGEPVISYGPLILGLRGGHPFGELSIHDVMSGEVWRVVTATFVHYGLLHIGLNLYALYQLGCLVESWYGSGQFLAIYVVTGAGGNLLSVLLRHQMRFNPMLPSGGGSVVVMGLVGLCAVVGWRARTRLGDYLRDQMVWVLMLTAAIGLILPAFGLPIIDNWGHACGALVGALIGLANRRLVRQVGRQTARWAGWAGVLVLAASAVAQVADDRREIVQRQRQDEEAARLLVDTQRSLIRLDEIRQLYHVVATPRAVPRDRFVPVAAAASIAASTTSGEPDDEHLLYVAIVKATLAALDSLRTPLGSGATAADYQRVHTLLEQSVGEVPTLDELREVENRIGKMSDSLRRDIGTRLRMLAPLSGNPPR